MSYSRKTIMHLIATNFYGGPEKQIVEHLNRLDQRRYRGILASFLEGARQNETLDLANKIGLTNFAIPMSGPLDVRSQWKLTRLVCQTSVDLLCVHGYKSCVMGWWTGRRVKIPVLAFSRGYTTEDRKVAFYESLERQVLGRVTGVIFVSQGQKRRLASFGIHSRRSWVVHNAISAGALPDNRGGDQRRAVCERFGIPENAKMIVSAGRLSPEKGHRFLVEAIAKMENKNAMCFVFCGNGLCQKDLERQAKNLGIFQQCQFPGFRHDLHEIFQVMDLMVLPSLTEGLPNVILEAFACARPVVATDVGGVPEIVEDGVNGVLVPPGRSDLLAQAIERCLSSPEMAMQMGQAGYDKVRSDFTFESQTRKLESIYEEILDNA